MSAGTAQNPFTLDTGTYWLAWRSNSANFAPSYVASAPGDGWVRPVEYGFVPTLDVPSNQVT